MYLSLWVKVTNICNQALARHTYLYVTCQSLTFSPSFYVPVFMLARLSDFKLDMCFYFHVKYRVGESVNSYVYINYRRSGYFCATKSWNNYSSHFIFMKQQAMHTNLESFTCVSHE